MSQSKMKMEMDCQTDITVNPPILDEDQVANVCTQVGCQTSLVFNPDASISVVMPELTKYLSHDKIYQSLVVDGKIVFDHPDAAVVDGEGEDEGDQGEEGGGEGGGEGEEGEFVEGEESGVEDQPEKPSGGDFNMMNMTSEEFEKNVQKILDNTVKNVYEFMAKIVEMYEKSKDPDVFAEMLRRQKEGELNEVDGEEDLGEEEESEEEIEDEASRRKRAYEYLEKCLNGEIPEDRFEVTDNEDGTKTYRIQDEDDTEVVLEEKLEIRSIKEEEEGEEAGEGEQPKDDNVQVSEKVLNIHKKALPEDEYTEIVNEDGTKSFRLKVLKEKKFEIVETVDIISPRKPEKRRKDIAAENLVLEEEEEEVAPPEEGDQMGDTQDIRQPIEIECECGKVHDAGAAPPVLTIGDKKLRLEFKMDGPKSIEDTLDGLKVKATISNTNSSPPGDKSIVVSFNLGDGETSNEMKSNETKPDCRCAKIPEDDNCSCSLPGDKKQDDSCSCESEVVDTTRDMCCSCSVPMNDQQTGPTQVNQKCGPECAGITNHQRISSNLVQSLRERLTEKPQSQNYSCDCGKNHSTNCLGTNQNDSRGIGNKAISSDCSCESPPKQNKTNDICSCASNDDSVDNVMNALKQQKFKDPGQLEQHLKGLQPLLKGISMQSYDNSSQKCVCVSSVQVIYKKTDNKCDCETQFGVGVGVNKDAAPLFERDNDYQEGYYDDLGDDDVINQTKGINSLPDVYNESTRCGNRTEIPWMKMTLPPPGSIKIKSMGKKICDCQKTKDVKQREKMLGCCTCLDKVKKPDDVIQSNQDDEIPKIQESGEHNPNCPCYNPALNCADIKPQKQIYDTDNYGQSEDYMRPLFHMYPDDDGVCDDKPEINWDDYTLPLNVMLGTVCGEKKPKRRKDFCIQNCGVVTSFDRPPQEPPPPPPSAPDTLSKPTQVGDAPPVDMVPIDQKFSEYTEIISSVIPVEGGGAPDQVTVSEFSTISDVTKTLKRMDQDFVTTALPGDAPPGYIGTVGSRPFNVPVDGINNQAVSMPALSERDSDIVNMVNYDAQSGRTKDSVGFSGPGLESNLPFDLKGKKPKSASFTYTSKREIEPGQMPLPFDDDTTNRKCIKECLGFQNTQNNINNNNNLCNDEGLNKTICINSCRKDICSGQEEKLCNDEGSKKDICINACKKDICKGGQKNSDSSLNRLGSPILAAIKTVQKEMKPLHDTLNELKMKIQCMDIPELDNWKKDETSCLCEDKKSKKTKGNCFCNIVFPEVVGPFQQKQYTKDKENNNLKLKEKQKINSNILSNLNLINSDEIKKRKDLKEKDIKNTLNQSYCVCLENVEDDEENRFKKIVDETMALNKMIKNNFTSKKSSMKTVIEKAILSTNYKSDLSIKSSPKRVNKHNKPYQTTEIDNYNQKMFQMNVTMDYFNQNPYNNYNMYMEWFYSNFYHHYNNYYSQCYPQFLLQNDPNLLKTMVLKSSIESIKCSKDCKKITKTKSFNSFTSIESFTKTESESYPSSKSNDSSDFMDSLSYDDEEIDDDVKNNKDDDLENVDIIDDDDDSKKDDSKTDDSKKDDSKKDDLKNCLQECNERNSSNSSSF